MLTYGLYAILYSPKSVAVLLLSPDFLTIDRSCFESHYGLFMHSAQSEAIL